MSENITDTDQSMIQEVLAGLKQEQKSLPSKFFYDERGSELFDQITELDEYYPTRTERRILEECTGEIGDYLGPRINLFEPGSGSSEKTRIFLNNLNSIESYIPIDISGDYLFRVADRLRSDFPDIDILPVQADYTRPFNWPVADPEGRNIVFFPGSTIGNFKLKTIQRFLGVIAEIAGRDGGVLIGVDLKKDTDILLAAYNDSKNITAAFNKNILDHINRKTGSDFDSGKFRHSAIWNEEEGRIEMHLIVQADHTVSLNGERVEFREGESIHTENSHKYAQEEFRELVSPWFDVKKVWTDKDRLFSIQYMEPNA